VRTIQIHEHLRPKLCDLYENDSIFDKFECSSSFDGSMVLTGSYHNNFSVFERDSNTWYLLEATKVPSKIKKSVKSKNKKKSKEEINPDQIDFSRKILHTAWHPHENLIAVAAANNLFLFNATPVPEKSERSSSDKADKSSSADK
jgi:serine/threonine-protein phosphatase 2A regulatory subunit B